MCFSKSTVFPALRSMLMIPATLSPPVCLPCCTMTKESNDKCLQKAAPRSATRASESRDFDTSLRYHKLSKGWFTSLETV